MCAKSEGKLFSPSLYDQPDEEAACEYTLSSVAAAEGRRGWSQKTESTTFLKTDQWETPNSLWFQLISHVKMCCFSLFNTIINRISSVFRLMVEQKKTWVITCRSGSVLIDVAANYFFHNPIIVQSIKSLNSEKNKEILALEQLQQDGVWHLLLKRLMNCQNH